MAVFLLLSPFSTDAMLSVPAVLAVWGVLERPEKHRSWVAAYAGMILCGAIALAKFSVLPVAVLAAILIDGLGLRARRIPLAVVSLAGGLVFFFIALGQSLGDLPAFLKTSLEVSSGFTEAMSLFGDRVELTCWLVLAVILLGCVVRLALVRARRDRSVAWAEAARVLFVFVALFIGFKTGFVRHDMHSRHAWGALGVIAMLLLASDSVRREGRAAFAFMVLIVAAILAAQYAVPGANPPVTPWTQAVATLDEGWRQFRRGVAFNLGPAAFLAEQGAVQQGALAALRAAHPLPALDGTVDMIPNMQARVLANGLNYRPRPTIQEYTTYSPSLIAYNRAFFESARAPDYLLFAPSAIDGRLPSLAEGALWPLFLAKYEPVQSLQEMLLLRKRATPLNGLLTQLQTGTARLRETMAVPATPHPLFVTMDLRPTLFGRLLNLVFRAPPVFLELKTAAGHEVTFRLIPAMARAGFFLSPIIVRPSEYLRLAAGEDAAQVAPVPTQFRIVTSGLGTRAYNVDVPVTFSQMQIPAADVSPQTRALAEALKGTPAPAN
ncbi:hypothetical protein [Xanthobacter sp. VNH20]|uniref:hypothetical protein n=1 Tax=Xanthobacter sp. VNH20 TaxID=3156616 RepID=UPI0032B4514B